MWWQYRKYRWVETAGVVKKESERKAYKRRVFVVGRLVVGLCLLHLYFLSFFLLLQRIRTEQMNRHHDPNPFDEEEDEIVNPFSVNLLLHLPYSQPFYFWMSLPFKFTIRVLVM